MWHANHFAVELRVNKVFFKLVAAAARDGMSREEDATQRTTRSYSSASPHLYLIQVGNKDNFVASRKKKKTISRNNRKIGIVKNQQSWWTISGSRGDGTAQPNPKTRRVKWKHSYRKIIFHFQFQETLYHRQLIPHNTLVPCWWLWSHAPPAHTIHSGGHLWRPTEQKKPNQK